MKKNQVSNYRSVFLKSNGINKKNAMPVAISPKTYAKIEQIIQVMGDGSCTVDDFVENVLKHGLSVGTRPTWASRRRKVLRPCGGSRIAQGYACVCRYPIEISRTSQYLPLCRY